jgi:dissimilatory sulfite reductase (desulfoviridin) alpha/beta subunit
MTDLNKAREVAQRLGDWSDMATPTEAANTIDSLVAEVERKEAENFAWRTKLGIKGYEVEIADLKGALKTAQAEVERLKEYQARHYVAITERDKAQAEVERLTKVDVEPLGWMNAGAVKDLEDGTDTYSYVYKKHSASTSVAVYKASALAAEQAKVRELVDCIEDLLDAVPPLWECAERAVDLLERIGEQK